MKLITAMFPNRHRSLTSSLICFILLQSPQWGSRSCLLKKLCYFPLFNRQKLQNILTTYVNNITVECSIVGFSWRLGQEAGTFCQNNRGMASLSAELALLGNHFFSCWYSKVRNGSSFEYANSRSSSITVVCIAKYLLYMRDEYVQLNGKSLN